MTQGRLLDSDMLIYYLNGQLEAETEEYLLSLLEQPVHISVISRIEVLGWRGHTDDSLKMTNELMQTLREIVMEEQVVQKTIEIRRTVRIKLPDAIIAASALVHSLTLVTRNLRDFSRVPSLSIVSPFAVGEELI